MIAIFVDFNNIDPEGCVRLNTVGTFDDLEKKHIQLEDGLRLTVRDYDLTAEVVVRAPGKEGVWRGEFVSGPFDRTDEDRASEADEDL
jgi:hypothetical protein